MPIISMFPTSDVASGSLPVAKGGTGASSFTSGAVLIGAGTNAIATREIDTTSGGTSGSSQLITSGAVYSGLSSKAATSHSHSGYAQILLFQNKTVSTSSWTSSSTYSEYPYAAVISCSGVTASYLADVIFAPDDADSGNFAPVALTGSGTVTIYSAKKPTSTVTIPTIKREKAVEA